MDVLIQSVRNAPSGAGCKHVEITAEIAGRTHVATFPVADFLGEPDDPEEAFKAVIRAQLKEQGITTPAAARTYLLGRTVKL